MSAKSPSQRVRALRAAFPYTIPIMAGFLFLGISYGIYVTASGLSPAYPISMALLVFGGSMEFVARDLLLGSFNLLGAFALTLMVQARHVFYGLSMLEKYRPLGWKKYYLIFGLCDETFSINCTTPVPADVDAGWFYTFVTLLNQIYWVTGATLGALFGSLLRLQVAGLDFVMTALLTVVFLNNWMKEDNHVSSLIGLAVPAAALALLGRDRFMIPAMLAILAVLTLLRPRLEKGGAAA